MLTTFGLALLSSATAWITLRHKTIQ
jgi:hypothetical protein